MRPIHFLWGFLILLAVLVAGSALLVVLAVEDSPLVVPPKTEFQADQIFRAKKLMDDNSPRKLKTGDVRTVEVSQADLDLVLGYLAGRSPATVSLRLGEPAARLRATVRLPSNPLGRFLNLEADLVPGDRWPRFDSLQVGRVTLPGFVGDWILALVLPRLSEETDASALVRDVGWSTKTLRFTYRFDETLARQVKAAVVPAEEQARWKAGQTLLADLTKKIGAGKSVSLTALLNPLVRAAAQRSAMGDPAAENRAVAVVLGSYLVGQGLDLLVPEAKTWPKPVGVTVTLAGRNDFPRHFAISAAMAAAAGTSFADAVGVYKELKDSKGGSGFSFNDMAADRAGTRFGQTAVDPAGAKKLQALAEAGLKESDLFPDVSDLPEFLQQADFEARYGGVGKPEYNAMMDKINARVEALPLLRR